MTSRYFSGWKRLVLVGAATCVSGCISPAPPLGSFGSTGGLLGAFRADARRCSSGVSQDSFGTTTTVTFSDSVRHTSYELATGAISGDLKMVEVQRSSPFRQVQLDRSRCARFEVHQRFAPDGSLGADIELDCDTGDGGRVIASLHAASCR